MALQPPDVEAVFNEARAKDPKDRAAYLDSACGGDAALRQRVEQLIEAQAGIGSFLEAPAAGRPSPTIDQPVTERPGTFIGLYKLLQQIGEGGMGVVWMAEQTQPVQRKVALKVIKPGMDSRQVIARFEAERQALAIMDHVNIARVFDGGATENGRPYFVMELVHGVPITKYCDDNHLTPRERLDLFVPVCQAIQHAHQKGIIHRDIKPSNVMVTLYDGKPVSKVIDFGVAKATEQKLTERTLFTQYGTMVGTLEYMSPEQAEMSALGVDTRSDIYSLGVLLYELLTGNTPLTHMRMKEVAYAEILRMIKEVEPPKPSTRLSDSGEALASISAQRHMEPAKLTKLVKGELDWIVMKTLEKDRNRRYETASGFAADVQRYLNDEPVQACPPTVTYKLRKFIRRNKRALTMTSALALAMLFVVGSLGWMVRDRAAQEQELIRDRVARQAKVAGQVELILDEVERLARAQKWPEALGMAKRAEAALAGDEADPATRARVRQELADLEMVAKLEDIRLGRSEISEDGWTFDFAGSCRRYAAAFREYGVDVEALVTDQAATLLRSRTAVLVPLAAALDEWGQLSRDIRNERLAKDLWALASVIDPDTWRLRVRQAVAARDVAGLIALAESPDSSRQPPHSQELLAQGLQNGGRTAQAIALLERASDAYPADFWIHFQLAHLNKSLRPKRLEAALGHYTIARALRPRSGATWNNRAVVCAELGQLDKALADFAKAIDLDPNNSKARSNRGRTYGEVGQWDKALVDFSNAIELNPKNANGWSGRGVVYLKLGQLDKALADFSQAINLDPKNANTWSGRGVVNAKRGQVDKAIADYAIAIEVDPKHVPAWINRGDVYLKLGQLDKALEYCTKAIELDPKHVSAWINRGAVYLKLDQLDTALADFSEAIKLDPKKANAWSGRGVVYAKLGQVDKSVADYSKAIALDPKLMDPWYNRGQHFEKLGQADQAVADYTKAIELDPKFVSAWTHRGAGYLKLDQLDKALADFSEVIKLNPKKATAWSNRGVVYAKLGQMDKSVADYSKAIELDPKVSKTLWYDRGCHFAKLGQPNKAVADFNKAIELDPKYVKALNERAFTYMGQGQWAKAAADYARIVEMEPQNDGARHKLASCQVQLGRYQDALDGYRQLVDRFPKAALSHNDLAWLLATCPDTKFRDPGRAVELAKKAVELTPKQAGYWNTLGVAHFRAADWKAAGVALEKSMGLRKGGDANDWFILAMVHWKLDQKAEARKWYDRGVAWMDKNQPRNEELRRFRAEAAELLGLKDK